MCSHQHTKHDQNRVHLKDTSKCIILKNNILILVEAIQLADNSESSISFFFLIFLADFEDFLPKFMDK
jgi:hypothetical protein